MELLLTETLRALSIHTRVQQKCIQNLLTAQFSDEFGTLTMHFFMVFIGETRNLVKEVGDEHLIVSLKQNGGEVPAHTA